MSKILNIVRNMDKEQDRKQVTMTDKRIIIDGIDVSGCVYYADGKCTNSHMIQSNCKNVAVCYYKEYKRKEQECEELKEILNEGCLHNLTLMTEQRVLLRTFAEIKEIAEKEVNNRMLFADKESFCDFIKILQKISEVEENE